MVVTAATLTDERFEGSLMETLPTGAELFDDGNVGKASFVELPPMGNRVEFEAGATGDVTL